MLYIICIGKNENGDIIYYRGLDTYSMSSLEIAPFILEYMLKNTNIRIVNASIDNQEIKIKQWSNEIAIESKKKVLGGTVTSKDSGSNYVMIYKENNKYKLIDYEGMAVLINGSVMMSAERGDIANCKILNTEKITELKTEDVYEITKDTEFEQLIASKYNDFLVKSRLLGYGHVEFDYMIENKQVKLQKYKGSSTHIILPNFITSIMRGAFIGKTIETLNLNEGLKSIGKNGFDPRERSDNLEEVEIPSTVELICAGAFKNHIKLFNWTDKLNTSKFRLRNAKTIVFDQLDKYKL